jgi:signal transduction histidine kinase
MQIEDNNEFIDITVTDEGIGIPEDEFNQLYEPFSRLSNVSSEIGSGLGLAIVKRAVEQLDAQIFVSSKINVGSEFQVRFKK